MTPPPAEQFAARIFIGPALRAQPDRRLVDLVRDGYDAAFEEIVRRYRRPLDRFAAAFVGHRSEDVTQDSFSKALLALRGSEAEVDLRPWLYRIVRNTALNDLRAAAPAAAELSETLPGARSAAAEVESREELRELMERLQALPETQRAALVMRELEGLSHEEIAAALGVSGGAARQAIFRARAALREGLGLLVPLPVLRALADHGEAGAAGAGIAIGGGALKAGMATALIAGAVSAGVAVEHDHGHPAGPEAAEAAPLPHGRLLGSGSHRAAAEQSTLSGGDDDRAGGGPSGDDRGGDSSGPGGGESGSLSNGNRSDGSETRSSGGGFHSGDPTRSGSGPGPSSNSGSGDMSGSDDTSGSGDRHGGRGSSSDDSGGGSGSGSRSGSDDSGSGGSGDGGGTSGGSGDDDSLVSSGDGGSASSGSGELGSGPSSTGETTLGDDGGDSGSGGSSSGEGGETSGSTSGGSDLSGSGDLSGSTSTSGSDGGP